MARRVSLAALANAEVEKVPGQSRPILTRLRVEQIAPTPLNPRRSFGSPEELQELGASIKIRQLQPVVVVGRAGYLKLWPDHEDKIGTTAYVLVNGERRYRAARSVEVEFLDAVVRDELTESRAAFLDAVLRENLDRKNFDPIEEANAVEAMVRECGTARAAAERFGRTEAWVSQRRSLLKLTPPLQDKLRAGELPVRIARSIATVDPDEQQQAWEQIRTEGVKAAQDGAVPRARSRDSTTESKGAGKKGDRRTSTSDRQTQAEATDPLVELPWDKPIELAKLIQARVDPPNLAVLLDLLAASHDGRRS